MSYSVRIMPAAEKSIKKWKKSNAGLHKKFLNLLLDLSEHPRTGIGHPEPLRGGNDITWSRHISAHDRIVYDIYDNELVVLVIEVEGHYSDVRLRIMQEPILQQHSIMFSPLISFKIPNIL